MGIVTQRWSKWAILAALLLLFPLSPLAADAQSDAWAKVNDCPSLAAFRNAYPDSRYARLYKHIVDARGQSCDAPKPTPKPTPSPVATPTPKPTVKSPAPSDVRPKGQPARSRPPIVVTKPRQEPANRRASTPIPYVPPPLTGEQLALKGKAVYDKGDFVSARELWRQGCYATPPSAVSCNNYAAELVEERSGKQDFPTARAMFARGCQLSADPHRCDNAWKAALDESFGPPDPQNALVFHERSQKGSEVDCTSFAEACTRLGRAYDVRNKWGDRPTARDLYKKSCVAGSSDACFFAAQVHALGDYGAYDFGAVRDYFDLTSPGRKKPDENGGFGCATRAFMCFAIAYGLAYQTQSTLGKTSRWYDYNLAAVFAKASCDASEPRGCNLLGRLTFDDRTAIISDARAMKLFETACSAGAMASACTNAGLAHAVGFGSGRQNETLANLYFQEACNAGIGSSHVNPAEWPGGPMIGKAEGCYNLAVAFRDGNSMRADPGLARIHFATACAFGYALACKLATPNRGGSGF